MEVIYTYVCYNNAYEKEKYIIRSLYDGIMSISMRNEL